MRDEVTYICDSCGEEIVVPIDPSAGNVQEYVEDCPVCCHPNVLRIELDDDGDAQVESEHE
jgi:DNA replicative helicase MCM subunit Mcm2 (Cdc46/Mcm family)